MKDVWLLFTVVIMAIGFVRFEFYTDDWYSIILLVLGTFGILFCMEAKYGDD